MASSLGLLSPYDSVSAPLYRSSLAVRALLLGPATASDWLVALTGTSVPGARPRAASFERSYCSKSGLLFLMLRVYRLYASSEASECSVSLQASS